MASPGSLRIHQHLSKCLFTDTHMYIYYCMSPTDPIVSTYPYPKSSFSQKRTTEEMLCSRRPDSKRKKKIIIQAHSHGGLSALIALKTTASGDHLWLKMASQEKTLRLTLGRSVTVNRKLFHLGVSRKKACSAELVL